MKFTQPCLLPLLAVPLLAAVLPGCTASANREAQAAAAPKAVMRYDQFQAAAANDKMLVAVGANGVIVNSADGGKTWTRKVVDAGASLIAAAACPDGRFLALDFGRKVWVSDAGAQNWSAKQLTSSMTPLAVACDAKSGYWVVGSQSTILQSQDQGATWKETALGQDAMFTTVQFVDAANGFITGEFGTFLATRDGGDNWQPGPKIPNDFYPYSALFTDAKTGWVSGLAGTILHTKDGGASWEKQANPTSAPMYGLARHGDDYYAVGVNGLLLKLAGNQWTPVEGKPSPYLRAALPVKDALLVAGGAGTLDVISTAATAVATAK